MGHACVHLVIDGYSRVVYSEIHDDEKADTTVGVLQRAVSWFSTRGVRVERVLSDNGAAYRSDAWQAACQQLSVKAKRTHPYRPRPTARSSASTAPWPTAGPTPATTTPRPNAARPYPHGCTSTITTAPTPPVTLLVVPGGPGLGQLLWARVSCPCLLMIRGAKVTRGSRALVTADKRNDPPQNGRGLS